MQLPFANKHSEEYFNNNECGLGCACVVGKSQAKMSSHSTLSETDVVLQMTLANLISRLSRHENSELALVLELVEKKVQRETKDSFLGVKKKQATGWKATLPTTYTMMRSSIIDGKRAILRNIPRPNVQMIDKDHAYVSVIECLTDLLGHGFELDEISPPELDKEGNPIIKRKGESPGTS